MSGKSISDIIKHYDDMIYIEKADENLSVKLLPTMVINYDGYIYLELSVGTDRSYVIKDPYKFAQDVKNSSYELYGKDFGFVHSIKNFEAKSAELASFIVSMNEEYCSYSDKITDEFKYPTEDRSRFFVSVTGFDRLFSILSGEKTEAKIYKSSINEVSFIDNNPKVKVRLFESNGAFFISFDFDNIRFINGQTCTYVLINSAIFRCSKSYSADIIPLFEIYKNGNFQPIEIAENEMPKFFNFIVPKISKQLEISNEWEDTDRFVLPDFSPMLNFNLKDDSIFLIPQFNYDTLSFNPLADGDKYSEVRNIEKEMLVLNQISAAGFEKSQNGDSFYINDEDKIYNFLKNYCSKLSETCELKFDESMDKAYIKSVSKMNVDVKTDETDLTVFIDNIDLNEEEIDNLVSSYRDNKQFIRLADGGFCDLDDGYADTLDSIINGLGITGKEICEKNIKLPKYRALYLENALKDNKNVFFKRDALFKNLIEKISTSSDFEYDLPCDLKAELRPYQQIGYNWLNSLSEFEMGGILADDMGLGKTLQVITLLLAHKNDKNVSIIITPSSLVYNWKEELAKFAPSLSVLVIAGAADARKSTFEKITDYDVVITSYDSIKRDIESYKAVKFGFAVIDEAQNIKNSGTQNAQAVKQLNAKVRFALTGTPIENSLTELWSVFDFVLPGYLFDLSVFKKRFVSSEYGVKSAEKLQKMINPFILRRMKKDVLTELPPKTENVVLCQMEDEEFKLYKMYQMKYRREIDKLSAEGNNNGVQILSLITRLRQLCCNPALFIDDYNGTASKMNLALSLIKESAEGGHKLLLFSQFTSMLDLIAKEVDLLGISYLKLTGNTKSSDRMKLAHEFNENDDIKLFLISLKAGGTGLNLTSADVVIHFDPWWNVSAENQASDRTHRIGQKNCVTVYKLVSKDTIEEKVLEIQNMKKELFDKVIHEGESFISKMSANELKEFLN